MQKSSTDFLTPVNYNFDTDKLMNEALRMTWVPFHPDATYQADNIARGTISEVWKHQVNWMQAKFKTREEQDDWYEENLIENITQYEEFSRIYFDLVGITAADVHPRFYNQIAGWSLPSHNDKKAGMPVGFNLNLTSDCGPLKFDESEEDFYYTAAVLNGNMNHYVPAYNKERFVLRFAISNLDYYEFIDKLKIAGWL